MKELRRILLSCVSIIAFLGLQAQDYKNEKQLIKGANDAFVKGEYKAAIPLFSTLISNYPKDPDYNFKYGASLLIGEGDNEKPIKYLQFAVSKPDVDPLAYYFFAKTLHLNYEFDKAIRYYKKFQNLGTTGDKKKYKVDDNIKQCENGKTLLKTITDLIVLDKKELRDQDFYKVYDLTSFGGQILVKPDDFQTDYEKKNAVKGIFYFPKNAEKIFFSRQSSEEGDKDIFYKVRNPDGSWSRGINMGRPINTKSDEDYPFLHPDGTTLYFASKGHNSLGGYDIFVSKIDAQGNWSQPQNLDFAINTPADDYLFITDFSGETAYFSSNRGSPQGEVNVYKINMERMPLEFSYVYGTFESQSTKKASIKVVNVETNEVIGTYETDENGKYKVKLPNDGTFNFIVDYEGSTVAHSGQVTVQGRNTFKPLKQTMEVRDQGTNDEKLVIKNLVDEDVEEDVELTAEFLKSKAKLKVNKDKFKDRKAKLDKQKEEEQADKELAQKAAKQNQNEQANSNNNIVGEEAAGKAGTNISKEEKITQPTSNEGPKLASADYSEAAKQKAALAAAGQNSTNNKGTGSQTEQSYLTNGDENTSGTSSDNSSTIAGNKTSIVSSGKGELVPAAPIKLSNVTNASNQEIITATKSNKQALENDAEIFEKQAEISRSNSSVYTSQATQRKAKAQDLLAEANKQKDPKKSNEYNEAQSLLFEAELLERKAATSQNLSNTLNENGTKTKKIAAISDSYLSKVENQNNESTNRASYEEFESVVNKSQEEQVDLADLLEQYSNDYNEKQTAATNQRAKASAMHEEVIEIEEDINIKETELETAKGKRKKELEEQILKDKSDLESEKAHLNEEDNKAFELEKEAALAKVDLDVVNEILTESKNDTKIASKIEENSFAGTSIAQTQTAETSSISDLASYLAKNNEATNNSSASLLAEEGGNSDSNSGLNHGSANSDSDSNNSNAQARASSTINGVTSSGNENISSSGGGASSSQTQNRANNSENITSSSISSSASAGNESNATSTGGSNLTTTGLSTTNNTRLVKKVAKGSAAVLTSSTGEKVTVGVNAKNNGEAALIGSNASNVVVSEKGNALAATVTSGASEWAEQEMDVKDALEIYDNEDLPEHEIALIPDSNSATVSHFNLNEVHEQLVGNDQSLRSINNEGYNQAYMNEFSELMENEGTPYEKAVKTYIINESWTMDIDREISYLEAISNDVPDEYQESLNERLSNLESLRDNKLNNTESSKEKAIELSQGEGTSDDLNQLANSYREELAYTMAGIETVDESELLAEENAQQNTEFGSNMQNEAIGSNNNSSDVGGNENSSTSNERENSSNAENSGGELAENSTSNAGNNSNESNQEKGVGSTSNVAGNSSNAENSGGELADNSSSIAGNNSIGSNQENENGTTSNAAGNSSSSQNSGDELAGNSTSNVDDISNGNSSLSGSESENFSDENNQSSNEVSSNPSKGNSNSNMAGSNSGSNNEANNNSSNSYNAEQMAGNSEYGGNSSSEGSSSNQEGNTADNTSTNNHESNLTSAQKSSNVGGDNSTSSNSNDAKNNASNSENGSNNGSEGSSSSSEISATQSNDFNETEGIQANASSSNSNGSNSTNQSNQNKSNNANSNNQKTSSGSAGIANNSLDNPEKKSYAPGENTDRLAKVLSISDKNVDELVEEKTVDAIEEQEILNAEVVEMESSIEEKQTKMANAKRKERKALTVEIAQQKSALADAKNQKEIAEYKTEALARAADNIIALEPGEEKESEKEIKRAETLKVEAEMKYNAADEKEAEKARGRKKKALKAAEVKQLKGDGDRIIAKASASEELAKEMEVLESDVISAYKNTPEELPKSDKRLSQAEVTEVRNTPAFAEYDKLRKQASVYYQKAQEAFVESENIDNENKSLRAQITDLNAQEEAESDITKINELQEEIASLETKISENETNSKSLKKKSKELYTEYNHTNNQAVRIVKAQDPSSQENLLAYVTELERRETYAVQPIAGSSLTKQQGSGGYSPDKFSRVVAGIDDYPEELKGAIFDMIDFNKSLYDNENPIPVDTKLPGGVVFKVQIGAFRNPPPQDVFKGFAPVRGESTRPGWTRYTAGLFTSRNQAKLKRNEIRTLGYSDAFVVAYKDGKRISLTEADKLIAEGYTAPKRPTPTLAQSGGLNRTSGGGEVIALSSVQGLMYTVQVGAFRKQITSNQLFGISPLVEYNQSGLFKYGSGIYNDRNKASEAQRKIVELGVSDAFVTAFYNGKRVTMAEASKISNEGGASVFAQEKPVSVSGGSQTSAASNDVVLRVQVGAYRQEVPVEDAKIILSLSNLGIDVQQENGMTTYTVGRYSSYADANAIKEKVLGQGLTGAFIVGYNNGTRIEVSEAIRILGQ